MALLLVLAGVGCTTGVAPPLPPPPAERDVHLRIAHDGWLLHPRVRTVALLPGAAMLVTDDRAAPAANRDGLVVQLARADAPVRWHAARGSIRSAGGGAPGALRYTAPPVPGVDWVRARAPSGRLLAEVLVLVLVPAGEARSGVLRGYRIGRYPPPPPAASRRALAHRLVVPGLVELTRARHDLAVSEHVRLGQLACKQQPGHDPAYLALDVRVVDKVERLIDRLAAHGIPPRALTIMSAYRTPHYNGLVGNETPWSRHTIGDAVDVFVDRDGDGQMDDLDGDGRTTFDDARALLAIVDTLDADPQISGGAAAYPATPAHGPFVHLDTRGYRARW